MNDKPVVTIGQIGRSDALRCKGWRQESLLRMLENTLANAEHPEKLIVYASKSKAARDVESLQQTARLLTTLEEDETLVIQSGKPAGVFRTSVTAPLVLMATSNLVGRWATPEHFFDLEERGLIMDGGYTAGDWQYIGSQGIVQGTYQTFISIARRHFNANDLGCRLVITAGLGGMGGAQPLAIEMAGGVGICVEPDQTRITRRLETGYLRRATTSVTEALEWATAAQGRGEPTSIAIEGNAAEVLPGIAGRGIIPAVVTDQTSAHDPLYGYLPVGYSLESWREAQGSDPDGVRHAARASIVGHVKTMLAWKDAGAIVFDYGNDIREQARQGGLERAFDYPGFVSEYVRPLFAKGVGPFRWVALSGNEADIDVIDEIVSTSFPQSLASEWIPLAREFVQYQGLPARIAWLGHGERGRLARLVNQAIADARISGPIAFTRDHLDTGGAAQPLRETENMADGSDAVSDWVLLNALLNAGNGADLVAIHGGGAGRTGYYQSAGVTVVADGTELADRRLDAVLRGDTGIGVLRHADAGYSDGLASIREAGGIRGHRDGDNFAAG